ncbi:MAG: tRNA (adenosine(37)-N6)-threonylcarbamoyltransferase complex ATPase subunit type 1 TsaE [Candidatus Brocadiia bacterium]
MTIETRSREETVALGRRLGRRLAAGQVVALRGPLGSGKTTLAKGIALGLGLDDERYVTSPTFVLVHEYRGRLPIYHVDLYRLHGPADAEALGLDEIFFGQGVTVVEWAERIDSLLPDQRLDVRLETLERDRRRLALEPRGPAFERMVAELEAEAC